MDLLPCLVSKGYEENVETFNEAGVYTVEGARKLSKLQLVLLGIPEDDCPELIEHIAEWAGSEEEMKRKRKMERKRQRALKRVAKGLPMVLSSEDEDEPLGTSTEEDSSDDSDSDEDEGNTVDEEKVEHETNKQDKK
tara:strand:- start:63 stop:473 length:411 start_codon:yes stop_codon:yes gene_type:complete